ncbi:uncharacterized protein LOC127840931 isoform X2 [Dreissena polymorpha]|uniref:uncharacterized protein LOC127840931 isoform X2 n=1 Tax=Dreissena polymorpha TaxID=45954 RepID=UPI0022651AD2|nr:uncharacterized protein LOC127840931 isoform X2 [Dreissena polymorpha]
MYSLTKIVPRFNRLVVRGLYSDVQASKQIPELPAYLFGQTNISDKGVSTVMEQDLVSVEGFQGEIRDLSVPEARHVLSQATEYEIQGPSVQIAPEQVQLNYSIPSEKEHQPTVKAHSDVFEGLGSHVSLHGHMQSNVPYPHVPSDVSSGYGSFQNMPGGTARLLDKYVSAGAQACHPSRQFSTSSKNSVSQQGSQEKPFEATEILQDVSPQGIQGDNCVSFKLWMENCQRYHLPNCDEQLASLKSGRKSLAQVFKEQQDIIRLVAEDYKRKQESQFKMAAETNAQGQQDYFGYAFSFSAHDPCPQGFQGDDCATYKAWAHNCKAFGFGDCAQKDKDIQSGRRTLQEVFDEQEELIKKIVANYTTSQAFSDATSGTTGQRA